MKSYKEIHFDVWKEYNYMPLSEEERKRIERIVITELVELVERFDGPANVIISFEAKGNC